MEREEAFLGHFLRHQDDIRAVIGAMVRDRHAREDIFQDVSVVLWKKFDVYDPARSFGAWARGIAVRKILQFFDRTRRQGPTLSGDAAIAVLDAFDETADEGSERTQALRLCMERLPARSRELLRLRYDQGLKLKDMGDRLARSLDAVHKALSRIRAALRRCVEEEMAALLPG